MTTSKEEDKEEKKEMRILERTPSAILNALNNDEKVEYLASLPAYLALLHEGELVRGDSYVPMNLKPDWLDMNLLRRGQKFAMRNESALNLSNFLGLLVMFSFPEGLGPLIFTGKSDSVFKAYRRYLSTNERVISWFEDDLWRPDSKAHRNLKMVRAMHDSCRQRMTSGEQSKVKFKSTLEGQGVTNLRTGLLTEIVEDAQAVACPFAHKFRHVEEHPEHINQMGMALTQFGFVGLTILYPKHFGIHGESDKDFEGFLHLWRAIGFLLGIEDRFNICNATLVEVRQRCQDIVDHWVRPNFTTVGEYWAHMSHVAAEGISLFAPTSFSIAILLLFHILRIPYTRILAALSFCQKFQFYVIIFCTYWIYRLPFVRKFLVWFFKRNLRREFEATPEMISKKEKRAKLIEERPSPPLRRLTDPA